MFLRIFFSPENRNSSSCRSFLYCLEYCKMGEVQKHGIRMGNGSLSEHFKVILRARSVVCHLWKWYLSLGFGYCLDSEFHFMCFARLQVREITWSAHPLRKTYSRSLGSIQGFNQILCFPFLTTEAQLAPETQCFIKKNSRWTTYFTRRRLI